METKYLVCVIDDAGIERYLAYSHRAGRRAPIPSLRNDETAAYPMTTQEAMESAEYAVRHLHAKEVRVERVDARPMKFYEVVLDNCDGNQMTVHVWENGTHTIENMTKSYSVQHMVKLYWRGSQEEQEAPQFVKDWAERIMAGL